jgi:two-component system, sensor histidine kinase and response regulator
VICFVYAIFGLVNRNTTMKNSFSSLRYYLINMGSCVIVVVSFAAVQYQIVQGVAFSFINYIIPFVVGSIFGFLITRIQSLQKKYIAEKDLVFEKNKQIHSYLGTIVHDLRSPVAAIFSLTEIVLDEKDKLDPEQREYIGLINVSASSILENISLILDNAKLEKGMGPDHLENGNPYFTINSTIDKHLVLAIQKSISIQRLIDKNLPEVQYDKDILDRVVSNLISNAIKYSPQNTQIKVYTELFADRINLVVKDEGLGMTEEDLAHLFEEFRKLSARPTAGEASSGLGLSVAMKLVKQIGGEIYAESAGKNQGSTFRIGLKLSTRS